MTNEIERRTLLQMLGLGVVGSGVLANSLVAYADGTDAVTIGWPSDVPGWDPNLHYTPDAQPLYKLVFNQPLTQSPDLKLVPNLIAKWEMAKDGLSLTAELRDDVTFHDGSKMTADDFRFTFFERLSSPEKLDIKNSWKKVKDIEVISPTKAVMHFSAPYPTAPQWLAFLGSYIVPKAYVEKVGEKTFAEKPIGTGPYKLVDYQLNARSVLERNDKFWGPKPAIKRVTFEIIKDPSARVAAIQSGQVDFTINVPVREVTRLSHDPNLAGEINPITRVILLQCRNDQGFADQNVRLAAHHAIDKAALSKAFYGGAAVPLSVPVTPGTPGALPDFKFAYDPEAAKKLLAKSGYSTSKPAKITFGATNGHFPSDFDIARAIQQMWKKVGIDAEIETIEYSKYFQLNRGGKLPDATLYSWDNATADPEIFGGYLLNAKMPFSAFKDPAVSDKFGALFGQTDYDKRIAGYKEAEKFAVEYGATIPLLQSVLTVVRKKKLAYQKYGNGWILANTMKWG